MKNLSNYINERLILSKNIDKTLSNVKLKQNECIIRISDFYCWWFGVDNFDDIRDVDIDSVDPWYEQVKNGSFKNQYEVYDFIKDFVDNNEDYGICKIIRISNDWNFKITFKEMEFNEICINPLPKSVVYRLPDNFSNDIELSESLLNERLILSKTKPNIDDLSDIELNNNQCIIRLGEFYRWYWGVSTFLSLKKNNLSDFEYCCGNMKGEFKGSPEELINYLFKFVKNEEDYAVCTIISTPGEWEFEINFKDIEFDETSVDPLPKSIIHRLPDNFNADIDFDESLLNERLVLSKSTNNDYTLDILDKDTFEDEYKSLLKQFVYSGKPLKVKDVIEPEYYVSFEETERVGSAMWGLKYFRILKPGVRRQVYETYDIRASYSYDKLNSIKLVKEWERGRATDIFPRKSKYNKINRIGIYKVPEDLIHKVTEIINYYNEKHNVE